MADAAPNADLTRWVKVLCLLVTVGIVAYVYTWSVDCEDARKAAERERQDRMIQPLDRRRPNGYLDRDRE